MSDHFSAKISRKWSFIVIRSKIQQSHATSKIASFASVEGLQQGVVVHVRRMCNRSVVVFLPLPTGQFFLPRPWPPDNDQHVFSDSTCFLKVALLNSPAVFVLSVARLEYCQSRIQISRNSGSFGASCNDFMVLQTLKIILRLAPTNIHHIRSAFALSQPCVGRADASG